MKISIPAYLDKKVKSRQIAAASVLLACVILFMSSCRNKDSSKNQSPAISSEIAQLIEEEKKSGYQGEFIENLEAREDALNFLVIGDWGRNGQYHQLSVAKQLASAAITLDTEFIISTGDNFYPNGVASTSDPLWRTSFEDIYSDYPLLQDWKVVLGNHDYRGSPEAQIAYSKISGRWNMPDYYFSEKLAIGEDSSKVLLVYIDTNPFVKKYYQDVDYKNNLVKQDTLAQKRWLNAVLADPDPNIKWKIVVGHHPLYCGGKRAKSPETYDIRNSFEPVFKKHRVDAYLCGHEHDLQHIKPAGTTHYFVSGAGCEIRPTGNINGTQFAKSDFGFMAFSVSPRSLSVQVINDRAEIIYKNTIKK